MSTGRMSIALNNYLQSKDMLPSLRWEESSSGLAHAPVWTSICKIDDEVISTGTGSHKNIARDVAAEEALRILRSRDT
ncbi:hypothetical protein HETIRDRAFT_166337 [Heterobasidion irregulare TC 32-1]|uniref:DRBM domain-containing protein n=1 Tax=Heterobasidion irregulare (strain TC 32-1) TaxID=747525 RepID=W4KP68_HETIT|nr:uncharacterized protein HETIRDRAFT_166337 [Heterobasidion irregulare TC 32-1]ETW86821.1 hypothetical protein HETIRDRAFT_166337 [Heterobasidion irregulare TC 32-1]